jgi:hypothetical protein
MAPPRRPPPIAPSASRPSELYYSYLLELKRQILTLAVVLGLLQLRGSRAPDQRPWRPAGRAVGPPAPSAPASQELLLPAPRRPPQACRAR